VRSLPAALLVSTLVTSGLVASGCDARLEFQDKVGCELDSECPGGRCDTTSRTCVRCLDDADCPLAGLHCEPIGHTCVECVDDTQCKRDPMLRRCDSALHRCVGCGNAADCRAGDTCEPLTHRCLSPCPPGGFCLSPGDRCDSTRNVCLDCFSSADCHDKARKTCEPLSGRCVQCTADAQCAAPTARCDRLLGRCVGCRDQADCPAGMACDPTSRACVSP